ncbi:MAG: AAA family ATPase [Dehalococcoidales bacterium]|nr:MAG: AAA family ATPase [Dehalococcoidales bacterium]
MKVAAIVGMAGSGKSEAATRFEQNGFTRIRFGDITDEEVTRRGLPLNEDNERAVREALRRENGMAAYAILNKPKIDAALKVSNVVVDGLYSWEEYLFLKEYYDDDFIVIAVWSSPDTRYSRLAIREKRGLTQEESSSRDKAEIENVNKGGPIAMADFTIVNESTMENLIAETDKIISRVNG